MHLTHHFQALGCTFQGFLHLEQTPQTVSTQIKGKVRPHSDMLQQQPSDKDNILPLATTYSPQLKCILMTSNLSWKMMILQASLGQQVYPGLKAVRSPSPQSSNRSPTPVYTMPQAQVPVCPSLTRISSLNRAVHIITSTVLSLPLPPMS